MSSDKIDRPYRLIEANNSILIAIDIQDSFIEKLEEDRRKPLLDKSAFLIEIAKQLNIPIVVSAEDIPDMGGVCKKIMKHLPNETKILNKMTFGLADDPVVMPEVAALNRKTAVLIGLETDVCVTHSALGLLDRGYRVAIVADATQSPGNAHQQGLERLHNSGVIMTTTKGIYYEWLRDVKTTDKILSNLSGIINKPADIIF